MTSDEPFSRRRVLRLSGVAVGTALIAGCGDDGGGPGDNETDNGADTTGNGNETGGNGNETGVNGNETGGNGNETGENGNETDRDGNETGENGNETGENGNETDGDGNETGENGDETGGAGGEALEPGQIELDGQVSGWVGIAPDAIADEENPTLTLQEGETYELGWTQGDGRGHNIEVWDENDEVVDDLSTDITADPGDGQWLEFEASSEMVRYVCNPHSGSMTGEIQVE